MVARIPRLQAPQPREHVYLSNLHDRLSTLQQTPESNHLHGWSGVAISVMSRHGHANTLRQEDIAEM